MVSAFSFRFVILVASLLFCSATAHSQVPAQANQYKARLIREARAAGGLRAPVSLFASQIHQESGWREAARSGVGALGIAQFMPGTASWLAQIYPKDLGPAAPLDPSWAIRALVLYDYRLYGRLKSFQDSSWPSDRWAAALSAYNGGLTWVGLDQRSVSNCDRSLWWICVSLYTDSRKPENIRQNRDYPRKIILLYQPIYVKAGWQN